MSCPHYYFKNNDYYCLKREDYVSSDTYYRYCRDYSYDDCPVYKDESIGGCYISTACISTLGCSDKGTELTILRQFRDTYMKSFPEGAEDIKEYYKYAPLIVDSIDKHPSKKNIYTEIYSNCIKPCLAAIATKDFQKAHQIYKKHYIVLKEKFLK